MIGSRPWWESRTFILLALIASVLPLLWPTLPPLADLPGHIGRYHIAGAIGHSPDLARHWRFEWALIGNLGVDLPVYGLTPLIGVEAAARLVVTLIPALWVSGLILVSHVSDGRLSPAAAFAFPLAYSFPFQLGFVNFMLSTALALHALALWIVLGRRQRFVLRTVLFVPISCALWIAHSSGWGLFGLFAFATDLARRRMADESWRGALVASVVACLPLAIPVLAMIGADRGAAGVEWALRAKIGWIPSLLRERWKGYDVACAILLFGLLWMAVRDRRLRFEPIIGAAALIALLAFLAMPRLAMGGSYVDMRMLAPAVAMAIIAIRSDAGESRFAGRLAIAAALFFTLRTVTSTVAMILAAQAQQRALEVTPHIPRGSAVLVLVREPCPSAWSSDRLGHLPGLVIARRDIFANSQWTLSGQQLLSHRHAASAPYAADPSHLVYPLGCESRRTDAGIALRDFDRHLFTHVWTIGFAARARVARDVRLLWSNGVSTLYAVERTPSRLPERAATQ